MRDDIAQTVAARLRSDYAMKHRGAWLRSGKCPSCGHRELYANATTPWVVRCGRLNKCAWEASAKELYPDAFERLADRYPSSSAEPNATADAYMSFVRGLPLETVRRWYRQGRFVHPHGDRATATVLFDIGPTGVWTEPLGHVRVTQRPGDIGPFRVWMERLVETVRIAEPGEEVEDRRQHFHGRYKGLAWTPPDQTIADGDELWLTEGCIDAISLACAGRKVAATFSAANYPGDFLQSLLDQGIRPRLVWAADNDNAGRGAIKRNADRAQADGWTSRAALVPQTGQRKRDWNDVWQAGDLAADAVDVTLDRALFHGDLLLAPTPLAKGKLIWQRKAISSFGVENDGATYWWQFRQSRYEKAIATDTPPEEAEDLAIDCYKIVNCTIKFLYYQRAVMTDESWYYARIDFPHGKHSSNRTFRGSDIANPSEFKRRLLSVAPGALWTGNAHQLDWLVARHLRNIRVVETVDFIGYSRDHGTYVFPTFAVRDGAVYRFNDEDFVEVGKYALKSLNVSLGIEFGRAADYRRDWPALVYRAFGAQGLIAAAFFLGALVAEQIRAMHKSYPFLEIVGEAGAGKSTLIEVLWKLLGRADYEGIDPNKSTLAARSRLFSQVANLPVSLIESDRENTAKQGHFDWDELKTAFNGRASRARGVKNSGNDTHEPPFRGAIVISQNQPVAASEAIIQRIIHLALSCADHTADSKAAADELAALPVEAVSHWLVLATCAERQVLETVRHRAPLHERVLLDDPLIKSHRIAKNHGQLMALADALSDLCEIPDAHRYDMLETLHSAAADRQDAISSDHPIVEDFWEVVDYLDPDLDKLDHSRNPDVIALNLNQVIAAATRAGQSMPPTFDLKRHLKTSRSPRFVDIRTVNSGLVNSEFYGRSVKCWIFQPR